MAKRKRLTPANPTYLDPDAPASARGPFGLPPETLAETSTDAARPARPVRTAPIADVAAEASAVAALDEVTQTLTRAREEGRMVLSLPLAEIQLDYLVRDRIAVADEDMATLMDSLRTRGQQTPIEVAALPDGRYGLISGWRRCHALKRLAEETGDPRFGSALALLRRPDQASDAYLAMVEENEIRVGLSYYERARIAAKAVEQGVFETEKEALLTLYRSASRAKRSKIRSFLTIVHALDGALKFPEALGERQGLLLSKTLQDVPALAGVLRKALQAKQIETPGDELMCILRAMSPDTAPDPAQKQTLNRPTEPVSRAKHSDPHPVPTKAPITLITNADGSLTLQGDGVDADFRDRLRDWLAARG